MIRISDSEETQGMFAMGKSAEEGFVKKQFSALFKRYLHYKGLVSNSLSMVMLGLEGSVAENKKQENDIHALFSSYEAVCLGAAPGQKWLKERFLLPYFRDEFLDQGLLVDTLETVASWTRLFEVYDGVRQTILASLSRPEIPVIVYTHISHVYPQGASLYFSILAKQDSSNPLEQWQRMKEAVNQKIKALGVAISHHHGVGMDHREGLLWGASERRLLQQVKKELDPQELLNPEKLL